MHALNADNNALYYKTMRVTADKGVFLNIAVADV